MTRIPEIRKSGRGIPPPARGYVRIGRGWHMDARALEGVEEPYQRELVVQAARLKVVSMLGDGTAVLRGAAAAFMQGVPLLWLLKRIDITGGGMSRGSMVFGPDGPMVKKRSMPRMSRAGIVEHCGVRMVGLEQAMADCALWDDGESAVAAISGILRRITEADRYYRDDKRIGIREREAKNRACAFVTRHASTRKAARARRLIEAASALCESPGEARLLWFLKYWGFPPFRQQVRIGRYYADFLFEDMKLVVEFDGWGKVAKRPQAMREMLARDGHIKSEGYTVVHVTWKDFDDPAKLAGLLGRWFRKRQQMAIKPHPRFL